MVVHLAALQTNNKVAPKFLRGIIGEGLSVTMGLVGVSHVVFQ